MNVGVDITAAQLRADFDAVVLAGGATAWRDLPIPGRELDGIHQAMEFLPWPTACSTATRGRRDGEPPITAKGKKVIIIGGGDTGADCLGTSHRQGAASVHQFEIMPRPPEDARRLDPVADLSADVPGRLGARGGRRAGLLGRTPSSSRRGRQGHRAARRTRSRWSGGKFEKVEGSDFELEADLVLLAMGFVGPEKPGLLTDLGVELTERGNVARDDEFADHGAGVFVAGDMGRGQSLIVWAIAEGRAAAAGVDRT